MTQERMREIRFGKERETFEKYAQGVAHVSKGYVGYIRRQFADKLFDNYENETIRNLVLAYEEEYQKAEKDYFRDFLSVAEQEIKREDRHPEVTCLNNASAYAKTIFFLFGIKSMVEKVTYEER